MNKKAFLLSFLFLVLSTHCAHEESFLERAIKKSTRIGDSQWLDELLVQNNTAAPVLFYAAKYGHLSTFFVSCAYKQRCITTRKEQKRILKRLILSGNPQNVKVSFDESLLKPEIIDDEIINFAIQRSYMYNKNKQIYDYLKTKKLVIKTIPVKKRKRENTEEELKVIAKKTKYQQTACSICLEEFTEEELSPSYELPCKHVFHPPCAASWFSSRGFKQCPTCKQPKNTFEKNTPPDWMTWIHADQGDNTNIDAQRQALEAFAGLREANRAVSS
ncbi:MAG: hypothetical protein ACJAZS_000635 [Alteromonas naphthalenivorans]|jgi:hypothetical protein